jgi:hypothetical protein
MKIEEIDANFKPQGYALMPGQRFTRIPGGCFDLYGVFYDGNAGRFLRMPEGVAKAVSPAVEELNRHTAGGRLRFSTDADRMSVTVKYDSLIVFHHMAVTGSGGFILLEEKMSEDGTLTETFVATFIPGHYANVSESCDANGFSVEKYLPGGKMRNYILWFPTYNDVKELTIGLPENAKTGHGLKYRDVPPVVYYGSSITQGGCSSRADNSYQAYVSKWSNTDFLNLGFSGSAAGEIAAAEFVARTPASAFVMDYDYNAPGPEHLAGTHERFFRIFREKQPLTPVIFVSNPDSDYDPSSPARLEVIRRTYVNAKRRGDKNVRLLDGSKLYGKRDRENCTVDGTHPNDLGFYRMAGAIYAELKKAGVL